MSDVSEPSRVQVHACRPVQLCKPESTVSRVKSLLLANALGNSRRSVGMSKDDDLGVSSSIEVTNPDGGQALLNAGIWREL